MADIKQIKVGDETYNIEPFSQYIKPTVNSEYYPKFIQTKYSKDSSSWYGKDYPMYGFWETNTICKITVDNYSTKVDMAVKDANQNVITDTYATKKAVTQEIKDAIDGLIDGAPGTLNTLKELSAAIGNDKDYAATVTNLITGIDTKVTNETTRAEAAEKTLGKKIGENTNAIAVNANSFKTSITGLSVNGRVITYTKGDGTTGTITTQDTHDNTHLFRLDTRTLNKDPYDTDNYLSRLTWHLKTNSAIGITGQGDYSGLLQLTPWGDKSGGSSHQLAFGTNGAIYHRYGTTSWSNWSALAHEGWVSSNYLPRAGGKMTGNIRMSENSTSIIFRDTSADGTKSWLSGIYANSNGDEVLGIVAKNTRTHIMLGNADPEARPACTALTPAIDIKNGKVGINKRLGTDGSEDAGSYNLDVNGSINANGTIDAKSARISNGLYVGLSIGHNPGENLAIGNSDNGQYVEFVEDVSASGWSISVDGEAEFNTIREQGVSLPDRYAPKEWISVYKTSTTAPASASATGSLAIGYGSTATDLRSIAIGSSTQAVSIDSIAIGSGVTASNQHTIAMGTSVKATNPNAIAIGYTCCGTTSSVAIGNYCYASGASSVAIGCASASGYYSVAIGNSTAGTTGSVAIGYNNYANTGSSTVAIGRDCHATGNYCISVGYKAKSALTGSIAMGYYPTAGGVYSIAIGAYAKAYKEQSIVMGRYASATGTTEGNSSIVIGPYAESYATNTGDPSYQAELGNTVIGKKASVSGFGNVVVGVGGDTNRVSVSGIGNVVLATPRSSLASVTSNTLVRSSGGILIGCGSISGSAILIRHDSSGYVKYGTYLGGINNSSYTGSSYLVLGSPSTNYCYKTSAGASWSSASDIRDKTDIQSLTGGLEFLSKITPITYVENPRTRYSEDNDKTYDKEAHKLGTKKGVRRIAGVNAQETYAVQQEIYGTDNYGAVVDWSRHDHPDEEEFDRYWVQYERFVPYLIDAVKTLNKKVCELEKEIENLKSS